MHILKLPNGIRAGSLLKSVQNYVRYKNLLKHKRCNFNWQLTKIQLISSQLTQQWDSQRGCTCDQHSLLPGNLTWIRWKFLILIKKGNLRAGRTAIIIIMIFYFNSARSGRCLKIWPICLWTKNNRNRIYLAWAKHAFLIVRFDILQHKSFMG